MSEPGRWAGPDVEDDERDADAGLIWPENPSRQLGTVVRTENGPVRLVHRPGSEVTLWSGPKAKIIGVLLGVGADDVSYKVNFWNGSALATEWVDPSMIEGDSPKAAIGFRGEKT